MSLATRCTACGTIFRVVQDQLKVSEGWVRCGRCQEVFSALEGLFDLEREAPPQRALPALSASEVGANGGTEFVASELPPAGPAGTAALPATSEDDALESRFLAAPSRGRDGPPDFVDARFPSELPLDAAIDELPTTLAARDERGADADADAEIDADTETATAASTDEEPEAADSALSPPPSARRGLLQRWRERREARETAALSSLLQPAPPQEAPAEAAPAPAAGAAVISAPGFVREADRAARWQRPRVRASLAVAGLLLLGALGVQVAVQFRDTLAAHRPDLRPALETLCEVMRCEIGPLRRLAALTVESSALTQTERSDAYRLSLTLLNRGPVALAAPSVELSLTDTRGALVARRALSPAEFRTSGPGAAVPLAAGTETPWQTVLAIDGVRVSGYTIELFYP